MGQETQRIKDEDATGRDLPNADGTVSDEDFNAIDGKASREGGQDHSTENHGETIPDGGVAAVQDSSDTGSDIAHINDE